MFALLWTIGTIEEWLLRYRRGGLDGLEDSRRSDLGKSRRIDAATGDAIADLAESRPELDGPGLLAELSTSRAGATLPSLATLYASYVRVGSISVVPQHAKTTAPLPSTSPATAGKAM